MGFRSLPDPSQWGMNVGRMVFSQLIGFLPDRDFRRCVQHYNGDLRRKEGGFSCWDQFLCMAFAQFTYREGLRDIESLPAILTHQALPYGSGFAAGSQPTAPSGCLHCRPETRLDAHRCSKQSAAPPQASQTPRPRPEQID
jgi:hypothetical protein